MPLPIVALALVALPFMGGKMRQADPALLIVGGLALWWMSSKTAQVVEDAKEKVNIIPESGEFLGGLFDGSSGKPTYTYAPDQSGSPNPPTQPWWSLAEEQEPTERGPIPVLEGTAVPTSPIIIVELPSTAARFGANVREFFTSGKLLDAIDPFPDWR